MTEEAIAVYRQLAASYPARYRSDLARSTRLLATTHQCHIHTGRGRTGGPHEGGRPSEEAEPGNRRIYPLAQCRPADGYSRHGDGVVARPAAP